MQFTTTSRKTYVLEANKCNWYEFRKIAISSKRNKKHIADDKESTDQTYFRMYKGIL